MVVNDFNRFEPFATVTVSPIIIIVPKSKLESVYKWRLARQTGLINQSFDLCNILRPANFLENILTWLRFYDLLGVYSSLYLMFVSFIVHGSFTKAQFMFPGLCLRVCIFSFVILPRGSIL